MPDNRKALIRYKILDKCFCDKYKRYFIDDLVEEVNCTLKDMGVRPVSKRQIYADIDFMKSSDVWNAPIVSKQYGKRTYLTYSKDYSIMETPISEMEVEQLETLVTSLSRLQGIPMYDWIDELLRNLRFRFGLRRDDFQLISFEQNRDMKGLRYLSDLINYTIKKKTLRIHYKPFYKEILCWTIHPYYLKQYHNRWFLFGYNAEYEDLSVIALDRIESIEQANVPFVRNKNFDFEQYFRNIIGISLDKESKIEHVRLKFSSNRLPYALSKPIHHSQQLEDEANGIVSLDVIPNKELISELIWYRDEVEVLSPDTLREKIKEIIEKMYSNYFDVKKDCTTSL